MFLQFFPTALILKFFLCDNILKVKAICLEILSVPWDIEMILEYKDN